MVFLVAGLLLGEPVPGVLPISPTDEADEQEVATALALVLLHDAARVDVRHLRRFAAVPPRTPAVGVSLIAAKVRRTTVAIWGGSGRAGSRQSSTV